MTKKELEAKVINAQSAVAKREAVLAKHREQLAKLISKGADQYDIRYKEDDIKTATGKLADLISGACPPFPNSFSEVHCDEQSCRACWLAWLTTGKSPSCKEVAD